MPFHDTVRCWRANARQLLRPASRLAVEDELDS
jgi:hypothetical protein